MAETGWGAEGRALQLPEGEFDADDWTAVPLSSLVGRLTDFRPDPLNPNAIPVIAVDGRSGSGKSTISTRIAREIPGSVVVHTDDVAWHAPMFGWFDLLRGGILEPALEGAPISYRPPAWDEKGREGSIDIPADTSVIIVEGTGAGNRDNLQLVHRMIWVRSDFTEAERRGIERDIDQGVNGDRDEATRFWHEWMAEELAYFAKDQPWLAADQIVAGNPVIPLAPDEVAASAHLFEAR